MKRLILFLIMMLFALTSFGQNIRVTFSCSITGASIDCVTATNLHTGASITLPGNETLILNKIYPVSLVENSPTELSGSLKVFPNPFPGITVFTVQSEKTQPATAQVINLSGQLVAHAEVILQPGENEFDLSLAASGVYMISLTTNQGTEGFKAICTEVTSTVNSIRYLGSYPDGRGNPSDSQLKGSQWKYFLQYSDGDIILYRCKSCNNQMTVITDIPSVSKKIAVPFNNCFDKEGKSYATLEIGGKTWMAENLAWLPSVYPSSMGYEKLPAYYVYGYEDYRVARAKATSNYSNYGVLYNWEAARTACPEGWRLPTDADWIALELSLGLDSADAEKTGWRNSSAVGGHLKETGLKHWKGLNKGAVNENGFTALPGGYRQLPAPDSNDNSETEETGHTLYGSFSGRGTTGTFWTTSEYNSRKAWIRSVGVSEIGVDRSIELKSLGFSVRCIKKLP